MSNEISLNEKIAHEALRHYDLPDVIAISLINLSENATFKIELADSRCFALRVHRKGYHSAQAIESELSWLMALRADDVAITPRPITGLDGALIQNVLDRHVVIFEWESGVEPLIGDALEKPFEQIGEVAARLHIHARGWVKSDSFQRFTWNFETILSGVKPHWGRWRDGIGVDGPREKLFARTVDLIGSRLAAYGTAPERFGLIHGDLRLANLLIDGPQVKILDFDDCGFGWQMYDAATPVSFFEDDAKVPALIDAWKTGYRKVAVLQKADENEIPTFVMMRRLLLVAWIGSHSETELALSLGVGYTAGTEGLCESYLKRCG